MAVIDRDRMTAVMDELNGRIFSLTHREVLGDRREAETAAEGMRLQRLRRQWIDQVKVNLVGYQPHLKQEMFHVTRAETRLLLGRNQGGKTRAAIMEMLAWGVGFYPWSLQPVVTSTGRPLSHPVDMMYAGEDFTNAIEGNVWAKIREIVPEKVMFSKIIRLQGKTVHKIEFFTGSTVKFLSYEMDSSKFEGYTWSGPCFFDEPPPREHYIATVRGCMKHEVPIGFVMTPLKEPWIHEELYSSPSAVHCASLSDSISVPKRSVFVAVIGEHENPYLTDDGKARLRDSIEMGAGSEEEVEARIKGQFAHLIGRVYKDYKAEEYPEGNTVREGWLDDWGATGAFQSAEDGGEVLDEASSMPDWRSWPAGCVVDPHDRKPWAIGWFVITPDERRVWVAEWPDFDFWSVKSWDWGVDEYAAHILERERELGLANVVWRVMDPRFARSPKATTGTTLFDEMDARGLYFDRGFWSGDMAATRPLLRDALKSGQTLFVESCRNFRKGFLSCTWDDYRGRQKEQGVKERERPKYKDFCDVARYAECGETRIFDLSVYQPAPVTRMPANLGMG